MTVTRRIGGAVARNRAKRLFREWFRRAKPDLPALDLVLNARAGIHRLKLPELSRELDKRIGRAVRGGSR